MMRHVCRLAEFWALGIYALRCGVYRLYATMESNYSKAETKACCGIQGFTRSKSGLPTPLDFKVDPVIAARCRAGTSEPRQAWLAAMDGCSLPRSSPRLCQRTIAGGEVFCSSLLLLILEDFLGCPTGRRCAGPYDCLNELDFPISHFKHNRDLDTDSGIWRPDARSQKKEWPVYRGSDNSTLL